MQYFQTSTKRNKKRLENAKKHMNKYIKLLIRSICIFIIIGLIGCSHQEGEEIMSNLEFFKSLNTDNGLEVVVKTFEHFPLQYATTLGLEGAPQIRPIEFKFEEDGVLYFDTVIFYTSYQELLAYPYIQICICDQETMTYVRIGGKVNFTNDPEVIERCFDASPVLTSQFGNNKSVVIGYYLTEVWAELTSFSEEIPNRSYILLNKYDKQETMN